MVGELVLENNMGGQSPVGDPRHSKKTLADFAPGLRIETTSGKSLLHSSLARMDINYNMDYSGTNFSVGAAIHLGEACF
jgi:hypothetical protein